MSKEATGSKLTAKHKIGYALGDAGGTMTFALMSGFFTRYCLNVLKIDNGILATLLFIWNVWDAINDPLMGALMDKAFARHHDKRGKFRPWLLRSTPMLCVSFIALWTVPTLLDGAAMLAALFILKILYEGFYTMFNIPMGSLLSAMANNDEERAALSSARGFGAMGGVLPVILVPILLEIYGDTAEGYGIGAVICALVGLVLCFLHYYLTEERNVSEESTKAADNIKITDILEVFQKNRAFIALCLHGLCMCMMQSISGNVNTYMYEDVLGSIGMMSVASVVGMVLIFGFMIAAPKLAKRFGLERMIRVGLLASCVLYVLLFILHMVTDVNVWVHMIWSSIAAGFSSMSVQMQRGLVGEAIDYNEYVTGKRTEGSIYGTFNLARRLGSTIGSSLAVLMLGWIQYDASAAVQTAGTISGIKAMGVLVPGIFAIGSWAAFKFVWNITPEIRAKIAARKEAQGAKETV